MIGSTCRLGVWKHFDLVLGILFIFGCTTNGGRD